MLRIILFFAAIALCAPIAAQSGSAGLSGQVRTPGEQPLRQVRVLLTDPQGQILQSATTDSLGRYRFEGLAAGSYQVTFRRNGDDLNGVSTFDQVLGMRQLLGRRQPASPFEMLAADIDGSASVSVLDFHLMRRLILGIDPQLPGGASWRFLPAGLTFTNPADPFPQASADGAIPVELDGAGNATLDITGYKIGDLNDTAFTN